MKRLILILVSIPLLSACAKYNSKALESIASQAAQDVSCKSVTFEQTFWDNLKNYLINENDFINIKQLNLAIDEQINILKEKNPNASFEEINEIKSNIKNLVDLIFVEAPSLESTTTVKQLLFLISSIDVGDRSTTTRDAIQSKVRQNFQKLQKSIQALNLNCESEGSSKNNENLGQSTDINQNFETHKNESLRTGVPLAAFGARWALATAYQSCESLQLSPMTENSPNLQGIQITGKHPDGVGSKRIIASLKQVQDTHYYIRDIKEYGSSCFNVKQNPLIYDYGGKPYATTAINSPINFFKDNGDGTNVLGIDCSGYVFSAMAAAGLKLKIGRPLKASDSWAWGSSSYVEPQKNGLTCLNKISITQSSSIQAGDIVARVGHMFIIEKTGTDPLGLNYAKTKDDCSKLKSDNFDFTIIQSSNSKNGIGINRYIASEYLKTSLEIKSGLEKYAYYSCLAKFSGQPIVPNIGTLSVVRHSGTSECIAPRVSLERESCIQQCREL